MIDGATTTEAVAAFARLWVSDEHWKAADEGDEARQVITCVDSASHGGEVRVGAAIFPSHV